MADVARDVTIGMLGPLEVRVGFGEPVEVVGPRLRTLVIGLALDPDRVVLASQLMDAVWGGTAGGATNERAWPTNTWAKVGVDPQATARAVIGGWERGDLPGLQLGGLTAEEALALERPAMTYVREQLRQRLDRQLGRAFRRWLHPSSGRRPGDRFL
jgi:hypothetical protein